MKTLAGYRKSIVAVISAAITWVSACYAPDGHVTRADLFTLVVALAGAFGVYGIENTPPLRSRTFIADGSTLPTGEADAPV